MKKQLLMASVLCFFASYLNADLASVLKQSGSKKFIESDIERALNDSNERINQIEAMQKNARFHGGRNEDLDKQWAAETQKSTLLSAIGQLILDVKELKDQVQATQKTMQMNYNALEDRLNEVENTQKTKKK